jgi:hypothetical protein
METTITKNSGTVRPYMAVRGEREETAAERVIIMALEHRGGA